MTSTHVAIKNFNYDNSTQEEALLGKGFVPKYDQAMMAVIYLQD